MLTESVSPPSSYSLSTGEVTACRRWCYSLIRRCPEPPPRFGTWAWYNLPDESAAKVGAILIAALASLRSDGELELDLHRELEVRRLTHKMADDAEYQQRARAWRATAPRWGQSFAERRAAQLEAAQPRPGDFYPGRAT